MTYDYTEYDPEDKSGITIVKYKDVAPLIEWRELTEKDHPKDRQVCYVWIYDYTKPCILTYMSEEVVFTDGFDSFFGVEDCIKWKPAEDYPWSKK
jgi:hypothetical protein